MGLLNGRRQPFCEQIQKLLRIDLKKWFSSIQNDHGGHFVEKIKWPILY